MSDDVIGMSLLHEAASAGRDDILQYLLSHMKDKDISLGKYLINLDETVHVFNIFSSQ